MQLLTWNTNFCWKKENNEWKEFTSKLILSNYDIIILQEINPYFLFNMDYNGENGYIHEFIYGNKNIYYHEFYDILLKERPNDIFWGTAIITNEKIHKSKVYFYDNNNQYIGSKYFGYEAFMCYDFILENGNLITIINFYKKANTCNAKYENGKCVNLEEIYKYDDLFFNNFEQVNGNDHLIILTGDFNITKKENCEYDTTGIIKKIMEKGFTNKTNNIGRTMLYDNQNDFVFVNNNFSENIFDIKKVSPPDFYDHYGIEYKMKY